MLGAATIARPLTAAVTPARTAREIGTGFCRDQYRVELALSPGYVLRQSKWSEDVVSAIEVCKLLAGEYFRDRDRSGAQLECLPFGVTDTEARPGHRWGSRTGSSTVSAQRLSRHRPTRHCSRPRRTSRTGPDAVDVEVRIIGAAVATPGTAPTSAVIVSGNPGVGDSRYLECCDAGDPIGQPVHRSGDRTEDTDDSDEIHCRNCHYGDRGRRTPTMHDEFAQAEHT